MCYRVCIQNYGHIKKKLSVARSKNYVRIEKKIYLKEEEVESCISGHPQSSSASAGIHKVVVHVHINLVLVGTQRGSAPELHL